MVEIDQLATRLAKQIPRLPSKSHDCNFPENGIDPGLRTASKSSDPPRSLHLRFRSAHRMSPLKPLKKRFLHQLGDSPALINRGMPETLVDVRTNPSVQGLPRLAGT
jgi:hypothetical protein